MVFPKQLSYLLERDPALDGAVKLCVSQFEPWINHSHLPFFPEYTDHGLTHIQSVLTTATALIRDEAWPVLTPGDAAVIILAVLLHDCAMHLSEDGFYALLKEPRSSQTAPGMDADKPWHILWEDFYGEASRFDGRKLKKLFGDLHPARRPPENANDLTKRDRLLIGEFLRRHHPRLAQEIAHHGVPGPADNKDPLVLIGLTKKDMAHVAALAGIVARSHGADVRAFLPYLQKHFDLRQFKNIHPVFLMTLLRVGDYVQVDSDRAPAQVLQVKTLSSPVSQGEWKAHQTIRDIRNTHEDPEALFIDALPEDVETFLRIEDWLKGIQSELDASWAVLGEVYGRFQPLDKFGLILRRIRSTIDDPDDFSKKVAYIPKKAAFKAADADLLKLLIEPLYGNSPEIGIRELMQNALDAVRELQQYQKDVPSARNLPLTDQEADVVIEVNTTTGKAEVIISDRGIGMTPEIIMNYFLTAGASFRRSEQWQKQFQDVAGKAKVIRAGRFGIGALAGFLLGPKMEVSTRHVDEDCGVTFNASMESEAIELKKYDRPIGTKIRIQISDEVATRLENSSTRYQRKEDGEDWDWYCLETPQLARKLNGGRLSQEHACPSQSSSEVNLWRRITTHVFPAVFWTYLKSPRLTCNGIKIKDANADSYDEHLEWQNESVYLPRLSIFDPDAALDLNLARTSLTCTRLPFEDELIEDVLNDFLAFALLYTPNSLQEALETCGPSYPGSRRSRGISKDWYFTKTGLVYLDGSLFGINKLQSILVFHNTPKICWPLVKKSLDHRCAIVLPPDGGVETLDQTIRSLADFGYYNQGFSPEDWRFGAGGHNVIAHIKCSGAKILISEFAKKRAEKGGGFKVNRTVWKGTTTEWQTDDWHLMTVGNTLDTSFDFTALLDRGKKELSQHSVVAEVFVTSTENAVPSPLGRRWLEIIGPTEIPFDQNLRRTKLARAFETLSPYIARYEALGRLRQQALIYG